MRGPEDEGEGQVLPEGTLTFLVAGLIGFNAKTTGEDGSLGQNLKFFRERVSEAVRLERGIVAETMGDWLVAVYPFASHALNGAARIQRMLVRKRKEDPDFDLEAGIALYTGDAFVRWESYEGAASERAFELLELAHGGQILTTSATYEVVKPDLNPGFAITELGSYRFRGALSATEVLQVGHSSVPSTQKAFPRIEELDLIHGNILEEPEIVGRDELVNEVQEKLRNGRMVTLVGLQGVGKSALALRAAYLQAEEERDGAWRIDAARAGGLNAVLMSIGKSMGLSLDLTYRPADSVLKLLSTMKAVLLLDNVDTVVEPLSEFAARVLEECPGIKLLLTSRRRLNTKGEETLSVPPLSVPNPNDSIDEVIESSAVQLYILRLGEEVEVDGRMIVRIGQVARELGGLPGAIELAVKARAHERQEFGEGEAARERTSPEKRGIRTAVEWALEQLSPYDRELAAKLAIFQQTFFEGDIVSVVLKNAAAAKLKKSLKQLIDLGLIHEVAVPAPVPKTRGRCFRVQEAVNAVLRDQLTEGDYAALLDQHAEYFLQIANERNHLASHNRNGWLVEGQWDYPNYVQTLDYLLESNRAIEACRLANQVHPYWYMMGWFEVGADYYKRSLDGSKPWNTGEQSRSLNILGLFCMWLGRYEEAKQHLESAVSVAETAGDLVWLKGSYSNLATLYLYQDRHEEALEVVRKAFALAQGQPPEQLIITAVSHCGILYEARGPEAAEEAIEEAFALASRINAQSSLAHLYFQKSSVAASKHNIDLAEEYAVFAMERFKRQGALNGMLNAIEFLAQTALRKQDYRRACRLLGAAEHARVLRGIARRPSFQRDFDAALIDLREVLDPERLESEIQAGASLGLDRAYAYAREIMIEPPSDNWQ